MRVMNEEQLWALKEALPKWRARALRPLLRDRFMRFPTFDAAAHESITDSYDYFRYATLGLAVRRLLDDRVPGSFAEVGVWRGETSRFVHSLAPDRRYHLFDTFQGFPQDRDPTAAGDDRFSDTSLDVVKERIGRSPNVMLRPGFVPDTLAGLEDERFAFVLLDLDLYAPTVASLEFFYPRLESGGYLIVHDYNNEESDWACKRALDTFIADKPEHVIDIGDVWGSALLRKL
jgi:O-methyltransferase